MATTKQNREWYQKNREARRKQIRAREDEIAKWFVTYKKTLKCETCGFDKHHAAITFHHVDPKKKDFTLARAARWGYSKDRIMQEIQKCKVLCMNCHMILHYNY